MKRCFFIGHRHAEEAIYPELLVAVERHIEKYAVREFLVGKYGSFDSMAARAVLQAKEKHPAVRLTLLTPYHPASKPVLLPQGFDDIYYPFEKPIPPRTAIIHANEKAISMSDYLIAYVYHPGKARDFLNYAQKNKMPGYIINLAGQK